MPTPDPDDAVANPNSPKYEKHVPEYLRPEPLPIGGHHVTYEQHERPRAPDGMPRLHVEHPYADDPIRRQAAEAADSQAMQEIRAIETKRQAQAQAAGAQQPAAPALLGAQQEQAAGMGAMLNDAGMIGAARQGPRGLLPGETARQPAKQPGKPAIDGETKRKLLEDLDSNKRESRLHAVPPAPKPSASSAR